MLLRLIVLSLVIALLYAGPAYMSLSDKSGKRFAHLELRPTKVKPALPFNQVDPKSQKQRIIGFGGAFTEASAINFQLLPEKLQHEVMDLYFGPSGNDYTVGRVHMDSCDFSVSSYNFDNVTDDFDLKHWSLDNGHDLHTLVPLTQEAVRREPDLQLFLTPWSPPGWMKTNGVMDGSDSPGLKSDPRIHTAWANYFVKFIQAYEQRGINFWGLTPQNEPLFAAPWEACVYSGREEGEFVVNYLGPALDAAHLDHLNLMIYDHNRGHLPQFVRDFMAVPGAEKYVAGIAFHWYDNQSFAAVAEVHDEYPQHFVLGTEACNCPGVQVGSWSRGESYGFDIIGDLLAGASGWVDWNLILDLQGGPNHLNNYCDAGIIVNNTDNADISYFLQPSYFFMGHFSRFFRPNDTVIESSWDGVVNQLYCVSTRSHHRNSRAPLATVCMNQADSEEEFALTDGEEYLDVKLPPHSIASITWGTD